MIVLELKLKNFTKKNLTKMKKGSEWQYFCYKLDQKKKFPH